MKNLFLIAAITFAILVVALVGLAQWPTSTIPPVLESGLNPVKKTMRPFRSDQELTNYFRELAEKQKRVAARPELAKQESQSNGVAGVAGSTIDEDATVVKKESVTNTQEAGVDEGGIVKLHGDHLVVLRRGRLFTIRVGE